jgi:hypothetical protein
MATMIDLEQLLKGAATGNYERKVGSQFGSLWGYDGLLGAEATPEQYAAFGGSGVQLCHGMPVTWLGQEWRVILVYRGGKLNQVNVHADPSNEIVAKVCEWLASVYGKEQSGIHPRDGALSVQQRLVWKGQNGVVTVVRTPDYLQLSAGPYRWLLRLLRSFGIGK